MARKAYNGYPEKSYYDNTMYNGIVATGDPLNEGSFALITNFDISDSGKSLIPRLGYLTTLFEVEGIPVHLSDKIIMYREPNLGRHIIIDLNNLRTEESTKGAYLVDITQYNIVDNLIANGHKIVNYDTKDLEEYFVKQMPDYFETVTNKAQHVLRRSTPQGTTNLSPIIDLNGVTQYIIKMKFKKHGDEGEVDYWLKVMYREKANPRIEGDNLEDTLIFSAVDMSEQTTNFLNRNIASSVSLILDTIRYMEPASDGLEDSSVTDVNRPILLKVNGKYTTQRLPISYKASLDIKVDPTFYLQNPAAITGNEDTAKWAYRFDVVSTSKLSEFPLYKTPWRALETLEGNNSSIPELDLDSVETTKEKYTYYVLGEGAVNVNQRSRPTTAPTGLLDEEKALFTKLANGGVPEYQYVTSLGDLVFAYTKHKTIADSFTKNVRTFTDVDDDVFEQLKLYFVSEDTIRAGVVKYGVPYEDLANRELYIENDRPKLPDYVTTEDTMFAPGFIMSGEDYEKMNKMTPTQFSLDAIKKSEEFEIEIVYMPFISSVRTYEEPSNETVDETVYILSLGGIFAGGMYDYPAPTNIPEYSLVLDVPKKYTFYKEPTFGTIDLWNNFTELNINELLPKVPRSVFDKGVSLILYLRPYNTEELEDLQGRNYNSISVANAAWDAASYTQSVIATWGADKDVTYIDDIQDDDAEIITTSNNGIVFEDRLVIWSANKVYISEEGNYNYFTNKMKKEFPEEVLKIISFKTVLLVFTTQHLYAIHRVEAETPTGNFNEEGVPEVALEVIWLQQPVLYNINPERRYLDVIQVYNQMVLFYSNEGQLYMIRPSTTIDNETQFGIQYFNKSANSILANFHEYINDRLHTYNKVEQSDEYNQVKKDDVQIKAIVDIDIIRIMYFIPNKITFILNYDVVNNRYTTYDTLSFTDVLSTNHVEGGEMYVTKENGSSYLTLPISRFNDVDLNVDMHYVSSFKKEPIFTLLDSGNLNLNNHITKRMRDLKIVMKNIDSSKILYNAEVLMDDTVIYPFYNNMFNVRMANGPDSRIVVDKVPVDDMNDLFGLTQTIGFSGARTNMHSYYLYNDNDFFNKNSLLKTETLNSNKLIEYNSSITSVGKVVRIKIQLISKGKYKLQSFGIVYKERRI